MTDSLTASPKCSEHHPAWHSSCPVCNPDKTVPELNQAYRTSNPHANWLRRAAESLNRPDAYGTRAFANTCEEAADEIDAMQKRLDFAADGLAVVERRRDQLKREVERLRGELPANETSALREAEAARLLRLAEQDTLTGLTESDGIRWLEDVRRWLAGASNETNTGDS